MDPNIDLVNLADGVDLTRLLPLTTLSVWTTHSLYRLVVGEDVDVSVQGGMFFPDPASAYLVGARLGRTWLKVGWIVIGLPMEIGASDTHIVTSPVRGIFAEARGMPIVH